MKKRLVLSLMLFFSFNLVQAGGEWSFWIANSETGQIIRIFPGTGEFQEYTITGPAPNQLSSFAVAPVNGLIAYCSGENLNDPYTPTDQILIIYNVFSGVIEHSIPLPAILGCGLAPEGWSGDGSQLAFGTLNTFDTTVAAPTWHLYVLDVSSGAIITDLTENNLPDPTMCRAMMPQVRFFAPENSLVNIFRPWGGFGGPIYTLPALSWYLPTASADPLPLYGQVNLSTSGGEVVWPEYDDTYPAVSVVEMMGEPVNTIKTSDKSGQHRVIFNITTDIIGTVIFVENGVKVAMDVYDPTTFEGRWLMMDRNGTLTDLPVGAFYTNSIFGANIAGSRDGLVYLDTSNGSSVTVTEYRTASGETSILWEGAGLNWQIVYADPLSGPDPYVPLPGLE